ncbi:MAG: hypothetical protein HC845_07500 [Akkermansiaceae bacterium]|nr:hypothetical protein [Akkermansiaceae bacterium]
MIGGSARTNTSTVFALARLSANGILDNTFSGDGYQEITATGFSQCATIALQPDGKIVMVGRSKAVGNEDFVVARCNGDGTLDTSFGGTGVIKKNILNTDGALATALQPDGKILVVGAANSGTDSVVLRYNSNGTLDTSFSVNGMYQESFGALSNFSAVALQPDGKILLGGSSGTLAGRNSTVVRLNSNGNRDTSFDGDGYVISDINPASVDYILAIALQPDGRLVTAGQSGNGSPNIALIRYNLFQKADALAGSKISNLLGNNIYNTTGASQAITLLPKKTGKKKNAFLSFQNDGHEPDAFAITGSKGNKLFKVKYYNGATDVTKLVTAGTFSTPSLAPGASFALRAEVTTQKKSERKTRKLFITSKSTSDTSSSDTVLVTAKGVVKK